MPPSSTWIAMRRAPASMRVLDQLLDDRGRPLDDLAGGDLVGEIGGQARDLAHAQIQRLRRNIASMHDDDRRP